MNIEDLVDNLHTPLNNTDTSDAITHDDLDADNSSIYTTDNNVVLQESLLPNGWSSQRITIKYPTITTTTTTWPVDRYPVENDELGLVYIEGNEIKLKTLTGKVITVGRLDNSENFTPLEVIAAKKKLLEDAELIDEEA